MIDPKTLAEVENLAAGLREPGRSEEAIRYFEAIFGAMNATHTNGEQDALAVCEAIAMFLGMLTANHEQRSRAGILTYVSYRAELHHQDFKSAGKGARISEEQPPAGRRQ